MTSKINDLVGNSYPLTGYALTVSGSATTDQLTSLTEEKKAIETVLSTIGEDLRNSIEESATSLGLFETIYNGDGGNITFGPYGISSVRNWIMDEAELITTVSLETSSASGFICEGDLTSTFTEDSLIIWEDADNESVRCVVVESNHIELMDTTYVGVSADYVGGTLPFSISNVYTVLNTYTSADFVSNNNRIDMTKWMDDFDFAYDHLNHPIGASGTYGINARIALVSAGAATVQLNKNKQDLMDSVYRQYSTWAPLVSVSAGTLLYGDEQTFYCDGDMTSVLPSGTDLLCDCGVDKQKGNKVINTEYIQPSAASYTECIITMNINPYMENTETNNLPVSAMCVMFDDTVQSMSVSGGDIIDDVSYVDGVTFICPNDMTTELTSGSGDPDDATHLIATFTPRFENDPFSTRYFNVYQSTHKSNPFAEKTKVSIGDGLPITSNLEVINVST